MRPLRQSNATPAINPGGYDSSSYILVYQKLHGEKFLPLNQQKTNRLSSFRLQLDSLVSPFLRLI